MVARENIEVRKWKGRVSVRVLTKERKKRECKEVSETEMK